MKFLPLLFLVSAIPCLGTKKSSPNFVFILVDDLGWADIKCNYPESFYDTPNIDKLAENGIRFTQAYAANPVCSPTRAAIMTGKHPNRVNITDWIPGSNPLKKPLLGPIDSNELALKELTIAEKLKEKGYKTGFIGKWHLGGEGHFPENQGFDINIAGNHTGSPVGGYYSPYQNPQIKDGPDGEYLTDRLTEEGIHFINENRDNSFFLFLAFYTVHTPIQESKKHIEKYRNKWSRSGIEAESFRQEGLGWTKLIQDNATYASMVTAMDENVGRIIKNLEKNGLTSNTWIIFTSDNGGLSTLMNKNAPTFNGHLRSGKGWCYEGGIRVPLIIAGPDVSDPGSVTEQTAVSMDFFTTVLNLAGIRHNKNDGENLLPVLKAHKKINGRELFWHYPHYHGSGWTPGSALRKNNWKLVVHYEDNRYELFDLEKDMEETTDLSVKNPKKTEELKKILAKKLADTDAKFPLPNPDYKAVN